MMQFEFSQRLRDEAKSRGHEDVSVITREVPAAEAGAALDSLKFQYLGMVGEGTDEGSNPNRRLVGVVVNGVSKNLRFGWTST